MKKWSVKNPDSEIINELIKNSDLSVLAASVLASKGFTSAEQVIKQLGTNELSDPFLIKDMEKAAEVINEAIDNGSKICIYGDYDCDGIMATVILYTFLSEAGADVFYNIPERSEGYGLNENAVRQIAESGAELIVTVDHGISAIEEAKLIYDLNMKLVVTDHHQPGDVIPKAEAVVDTHQTDCFSPFKKLCGAGIALKLAAALDGGDVTMALEQFGDLAVIATIADIVELIGENRFIASYGMKLIENTDRIGLMALNEVSGISGKPVTSSTVGFMLAPRINSAGRFGSPKTAVELLLCEDMERAKQLAHELDTLNKQRKDAESEILSEIYSRINENPMIIRERVLFFCGKNWHHGVIGIVASRLMETFGKPCFIMSDSNGEVRGSARSFDEFSIFKALQYSPECLVTFGGHKGAGGFTVKENMTDEFKHKLLEYALENHFVMPTAEYNADYSLTPRDITIENIKGLKLLEPFGAGNEAPLFYIHEAVIKKIIPLSKGVHTKLNLDFKGNNIDVLIFRTSPQELKANINDICDFIVSLDINVFNGRESASIIVRDYRPSNIEQSKAIAAFNAFESFCRNEELPPNYYVRMMPKYDEVKEIYLRIKECGTSVDSIYFSMKPKGLNYCRLLSAIEALAQLKLISVDYSCGKAVRLKVTHKTSLDKAPILIALKDKCSKALKPAL